MHTKLRSENLKGRDHSEDLGVDGNILWEWILWETGWEGVNWMQLAQDKGTVGGYCEHGNEHSGTIKGGEILD
jgi:hypothetical protein